MLESTRFTFTNTYLGNHKLKESVEGTRCPHQSPLHTERRKGWSDRSSRNRKKTKIEESREVGGEKKDDVKKAKEKREIHPPL
jgi:hypothetical protein